MTSIFWYALYTKPKNEKKVAEQLKKLGVEVYCPLVSTVKMWSDRKKKVKEPLFKSYIFVHLLESDRQLVFQSHGVVRYVYWLGKPAIIRDEEIEAIKDFLQQTSATTSTKQIEYLQEVDITNGPFKGQKGKYLYQTKNRLVLQIESLGIVLKAEMHISHIV